MKWKDNISTWALKLPLHIVRYSKWTEADNNTGVTVGSDEANNLPALLL